MCHCIVNCHTYLARLLLEFLIKYQYQYLYRAGCTVTRQMVPPTEYSHDDVVARYLDGSSCDKVDGVENVSRVNERVTRRRVRRLELHRQCPQTTFTERTSLFLP